MKRKDYQTPAMRAVQMRHKCIMQQTSPDEETRQSKRNQYNSVEW